MKNNLLALGGALAGGALGYLAFSLLASQRIHGLAIPGGLLGMGAGLVPTRSIFVAIIAGLLALALGLVAEYRNFPFIADGSFGFFITHLYDLRPLTWLMLALGTGIGFWIPFQKL